MHEVRNQEKIAFFNGRKLVMKSPHCLDQTFVAALPPDHHMPFRKSTPPSPPKRRPTESASSPPHPSPPPRRLSNTPRLLPASPHPLPSSPHLPPNTRLIASPHLLPNPVFASFPLPLMNMSKVPSASALSSTYSEAAGAAGGADNNDLKKFVQEHRLPVRSVRSKIGRYHSYLCCFI